jgi:hypothetical protein
MPSKLQAHSRKIMLIGNYKLNQLYMMCQKEVNVRLTPIDLSFLLYN